MESKFLVSILITSSMAFAINTEKGFQIGGESISLVNETQTLKITNEETVQQKKQSSEVVFQLLGGSINPQRATVMGNKGPVEYALATRGPLTLITGQLAYLPLITSWGKMGLSGSLSYTSVSNSEAFTNLHIIPADLGLIYRGDYTSSQFLIPYLMGGIQEWVLFQRGPSNNASQAYSSNFGAAGLAINLNRLRLLKGRSETELVIQYKKSWARVSQTSDLNCNTLQFGGSLSL